MPSWLKNYIKLFVKFIKNEKEMTLGERIRELRKQAEWTMKQLAEASGLPENSILYIEKGYVRNPATYKLQRIADAFGVSVDSLLYEPRFDNMRSVIKRIKNLDEANKKKLYQIVILYLESNSA